MATHILQICIQNLWLHGTIVPEYLFPSLESHSAAGVSFCSYKNAAALPKPRDHLRAPSSVQSSKKLMDAE